MSKIDPKWLNIDGTSLVITVDPDTGENVLSSTGGGEMPPEANDFFDKYAVADNEEYTDFNDTEDDTIIDYGDYQLEDVEVSYIANVVGSLSRTYHSVGGEILVDGESIIQNLVRLEDAIVERHSGGEEGDVTHAEMEAYVTAELADYVLTSTLSDYVLDDDLTSTLTGYVTNSALSTTLTDYVTDSELSTTLTGYVTDSDLTTTLADYVLTDDLTTTLANYAGVNGNAGIPFQVAEFGQYGYAVPWQTLSAKAGLTYEASLKERLDVAGALESLPAIKGALTMERYIPHSVVYPTFIGDGGNEYQKYYIGLDGWVYNDKRIIYDSGHQLWFGNGNAASTPVMWHPNPSSPNDPMLIWKNPDSTWSYRVHTLASGSSQVTGFLGNQSIHTPIQDPYDGRIYIVPMYYRNNNTDDNKYFYEFSDDSSTVTATDLVTAFGTTDFQILGLGKGRLYVYDFNITGYYSPRVFSIDIATWTDRVNEQTFNQLWQAESQNFTRLVYIPAKDKFIGIQAQPSGDVSAWFFNVGVSPKRLHYDSYSPAQTFYTSYVGGATNLDSGLWSIIFDGERYLYAVGAKCIAIFDMGMFHSEFSGTGNSRNCVKIKALPDRPVDGITNDLTTIVRYSPYVPGWLFYDKTNRHIEMHYLSQYAKTGKL